MTAGGGDTEKRGRQRSGASGREGEREGVLEDNVHVPTREGLTTIELDVCMYTPLTDQIDNVLHSMIHALTEHMLSAIVGLLVTRREHLFKLHLLEPHSSSN